MLRFVLLSLLLFSGFNALASPRYSDPDGCLSCHAYKGLDYIDEQGVMRSATISASHYASSLHGSVPCKDCHRKIVDYPHKVENTEADCSESCHIEEPSEGVKYSHDVIHDEMDKSVHAGGWYKGLTGGNRVEEIETEQDPSCRRCHSNTLYIAETQLDAFKTEFDHAETECGNCHQGKAWMGQFGGHILRRLVGRRWNNQENNQMCADCHGDLDKMRDVEQEDPETKEKRPPSERFIHSAASYDKTLHGRLIVDGSDYGASCIDCHSPDGWKHEIRSYTDPKSASHPDNLAQSCGQSNCHGYAKKPGNEGFTLTDMHAMSLVDLKSIEQIRILPALADSKWFWASGPFILAGLFFAIASLIWWLLYRNTKKIIPIVGGSRFEQVIIGRKPKAARKKSGAKSAVKPKPRPKAKPAADASSATPKIAKQSDNGASKDTTKVEPEKNTPSVVVDKQEAKLSEPVLEKTVKVNEQEIKAASKKAEKVDEKPTKPDNDPENPGA